MTIQFDAVYQGGVFRPKQPIPLPDGIEVRVAIETSDDGEDPLADVIGIGEGPSKGDGADRHDDYIYGRPTQ